MSEIAVIVHNERIKLLATFLNGVGVAIFAVGGLAPVFSSLYGPNGLTEFIVLLSVVCIVAACALHYFGSVVLRRLKP